MDAKFSGVYTAIITPFDSNENVDYVSLGKLIEFQINSKINGIVVCGTTGESPTLSPKEHSEVIDFVIKKVNGRVKVIAGTGSNCTREAVDLSLHAKSAGADALLLINPYYNKPTQEGLYLHFKKIADSVKIPIILYNIKSRTGVNLETKTLLRLIESCNNIVGVKEASGDLVQIKEVINSVPKDFSVLSGDDNLTLEVINLGGHGVISVASNIVPIEMLSLTNFALNGDLESALRVHFSLAPLFGVEFIETNPIPIKFMLSKKGFCKEVYRLPMCELRPESKTKVLSVMSELKLI